MQTQTRDLESMENFWMYLRIPVGLITHERSL